MISNAGQIYVVGRDHEVDNEANYRIHSVFVKPIIRVKQLVLLDYQVNWVTSLKQAMPMVRFIIMLIVNELEQLDSLLLKLKFLITVSYETKHEDSFKLDSWFAWKQLKIFLRLGIKLILKPQNNLIWKRIFCKWIWKKGHFFKQKN